MKILLIAYHSQTGRSQSLADAAHKGALLELDVRVDFYAAREVDVERLRVAGAVLWVTPENFGYMSGELKAVFDRTYDAVRDDTAGRSYGLIISCGNDGRGAQTSVERIMLGYGMAAAREPLIVRGDITPADVQQAHELGQYMASALAVGLI